MRLKPAISWKQLLLSPYSIALVPSLLLILLLPDFFPKYSAELIETGLVDKENSFEYYHDIDGDGGSERIILFNNTQNEASIKIVEEDGSIGEHFYFTGQICNSHEGLTLSSVDSSGQAMMWLFTIRNDSLLLHCITPAKDAEGGFRNRFITLLTSKNETYDFQINNSMLEDLDGDGIKEFIAGIMAGFPLKPRFVFAYDPAHDTLIFADDLGPLYYILHATDINRDGKKELLTQTYSVSNYPDSIRGSFNDHHALILGLDSQLKPLFAPIEFPGKYIQIMTLPIRSKTGEYRLVSLVDQLTDGACYPRLVLSDIRGTILNERRLPQQGAKNPYALYADLDAPDRLYLTGGKEDLEILDATLQTIQRIQFQERRVNLLRQLDADGDGILEYLGYSGNSFRPVIFRKNFTHPVTLDFPVTPDPYHTGIKHHQDGAPHLFIQQGETCYFFVYGKNKQFLLKYPFYLGIYLLFLGIILLSQYLQRLLLRQRYDAEKKIAELQLLLLKNQLDPHFTFNAISGINALVALNRPEEANKMIAKLSRLMRASVDHTDKLSRSLEAELSFVRDYLSLEQARMENPFMLEIVTDPGIDLQREFPKMIIQIYAENAVKHGLRQKGASGKLKISLGTSAPYHSITPSSHHPITITIEDNGIGRAQAARNGSSGTGKGTGIMEQYFEILNKYNPHKITHQILDLTDESGHPRGTRVEIVIPEGVRYRFY